jgi:arylsulfatase
MMRAIRFSGWGAIAWIIAALAELSLRISFSTSFGPGEVLSSYGFLDLFAIPLLFYSIPGILSGALYACSARGEARGGVISLLAFEAALLFLFYGGLWAHARLLRGIGLLEPVSMFSTLLLLASAVLVFFLSRRVARTLPRPALSLIIGGILLACTSLLPFALAKRETASLLSGSLEAGRDVLLVTLDTTRRDALGSYGNRVFETPVLDSLAARGARFTEAISQSPFTGPSHASLLTSLYPASHGVRTNGMRLEEGTLTLASLLSRQGYATIAVLGGSSLSHDACGLNQGFFVYDEAFTRVEPFMRTWLGEFAFRTLKGLVPEEFAGFFHRLQQRKASETTDAALGWLGRAKGKVFLWVHYFDPHFIYNPPEPFEKKYDPGFVGEFRPYRYLANLVAVFRNSIGITEREREHAWALYGGEVSYVDRELGRLLAGLHDMGRLEDMLVVVVADHGEYFGEHGYYFMHDDLYDEVLEVPLIFAGRDGEMDGLDAEGIAEVVDIMPTILQIVMLSIPEGLQGDPFQESEARAPYAFSDCGPCGRVSVRSEGAGVLLDRESGEKEKWVIPGAGEGMGAEEFPLLEAALEKWSGEVGIGKETERTLKESERLKSLGYVW